CCSYTTSTTFIF
nr:immunoglobulin light chain junction region [Macaca mulatta]MPO03610.1 immunoglobulin light chain junction region [Macaca mulatta]MPO03658.1 immunoglobulin light chain junction region [Macaca mulatta]MPO03698.1 immunoglobulin light chain junction region [Macaca mulatta]MPO04209.1 immunoglobulin light chain junction region [Macaca mulatta]